MTLEQRAGERLRQAIPSAAEEQLAVDRAWRALRGQASGVEADLRRHFEAAALPASSGFLTRPHLVAAAVLVVAAAVGTAILWRPADDTLYRVVEGDVYQDRTIRSNGGSGAVLALADGSRIEMRSQTELALERADDGVRVRLRSGGIIVNAAKQRAGHFYVQTKDVLVSVVGTVFLVNAEEQGSRVTVIEGEVRVQQGTTEQTLRSGDQVATSPSMSSRPMNEEVAWSRQADALLERLQQTPIPQLPFQPSPQDDRVAFEVVSLRPSSESSDAGGRGGGDGSGSGINQWGCGVHSPTVDPRRFSVMKTTIYTLIVWAYGAKELNAPGCTAESQLNLITGGPEWIRSELFDIQALIPKHISVGTGPSRDAAGVAAIRRMIQTMLAERFNLAVRRETREMPVYSLSVSLDALRSVGAADPARSLTQGEPGPEDKLLGGALRDPGVLGDTGLRNGEVMQVIRGRNASITELATYLGPLLGRTVLDKTGLVGRFNFDFWVAPVENAGGPLLMFRSTPRATSPTILAALADAGLKLEPSKSALEVLVIDRIERPQL